jgi:hypothetical protein
MSTGIARHPLLAPLCVIHAGAGPVKSRICEF